MKSLNDMDTGAVPGSTERAELSMQSSPPLEDAVDANPLARLADAAGEFTHRRGFLGRLATGTAGLAAAVVTGWSRRAEAASCSIRCDLQGDYCTLGRDPPFLYYCRSGCSPSYYFCSYWRGQSFCAAYYPAC